MWIRNGQQEVFEVDDEIGKREIHFGRAFPAAPPQPPWVTDPDGFFRNHSELCLVKVLDAARLQGLLINLDVLLSETLAAQGIVEIVKRRDVKEA